MCKSPLRLDDDDSPAPIYGRVKDVNFKATKQNSEKRKEKSRDAARCRRGKESEIFSDLAEMLPLPPSTVAQLDKASIMRLALAFLKTRALHNASQKLSGSALSDTALKCEEADLEEQESKLELGMKLTMEDSYLKAFNGFVLIVAADTDVVYTSENIQQYLGLPQVDVMGNSLLDYAHPCDHAEVKELVAPKGNTHRHYFIRLKCTLTQKGRSVNLKSATYKVCQISGKVVTGDKEKDAWVVATASPVPHPSNIEFPLDKQAFVSKHSLDMKFTYVDDNIAEFMGYECKELLGRSLYEMNHAEDSQLLKNIYKILCEKGQVETPRYRFLARRGGYVWMVTQATLINGPKGDNPQYVVCINYVASGIESPDEILSSMQLAAAASCTQDKRIPAPLPNSSIKSSSQCDVSPAVVKLHPHQILPRCEVKAVPKVLVENVGFTSEASHAPVTTVQRRTRPQRSTSKIFTPRTEEMTKGYLIFSKDDPQKTVLKEEPDDLTHLAPCMPPHEASTTTVFSDLGHMYDFECPPPQQQQTTSYPLPTYKTNSSPATVTTSIYDSSANPKQNDSNNQSFRIPYRGNSSVGREKSAYPVSSTLNILKPISSVLGEKNLIVSTSSDTYPRSTSSNFICLQSNSKLEAKVQPNNASYPNFSSKSIMNMDDEDMEARAPYIPMCDEMLLLGPDDHMWGSPNDGNSYNTQNARYSNPQESSGTQEDSNLAKLLRDIDPTLVGGTGNRIKASKSVGQSNSQPNKYLEENSFVDPNKVLHVFGGDHPDGFEIETRELLDSYDGGTTVVMSNIDTPPPPPLVGGDDIDTPPPLGSSYHFNNGGHQVNNKRLVSPMASPVMAHKRFCCSAGTTSYSQQQRHQQQQQQQQQQQVGSVLPLLPVPNAPTMQQLLVSKDPIRVRGGCYGADTSNDTGTLGKDKLQGKETSVLVNGEPSVLQNLLVSGQDVKTGYTILIAGSQQIEGVDTDETTERSLASITSSPEVDASRDSSIGAKVPPQFTSDDPPPKCQLIGNSHQRRVLIDKRTVIDEQNGKRVYLGQQTHNKCSNNDGIDYAGVVDICSNNMLGGVRSTVHHPEYNVAIHNNNNRPQPSADTLDQHPETKRRLIAMRIAQSQGRINSTGKSVHTPLHLITDYSYSSSTYKNQDSFKVC
ncbi:unnamed protein product, partial [Meganyctiphanes norvegica]